MKNERSSIGTARASMVNVERNESPVVQYVIEEGRKRADLVLKEFNIVDRLGLNGNEVYLFKENMALRIIRTDIYDMSFLLHHPSAMVMAKIPVLSKLIKHQDKFDRASRFAEQHLRSSIDRVASIGSDKARMVNRTVELAVNDLVARSTIREEASTRLIVNDDMVGEWSSVWREKIDSIRSVS